MADAPFPEQQNEYPMLYVFRAISRHLPDTRGYVRRLVEQEVGPIPDDAVTERPSAAGKYIAVHVSCVVQTEEQRLAVYKRLKADQNIVFML